MRYLARSAHIRPVSEWRVARPEPSIGAEDVGKRWATTQDAFCRTVVSANFRMADDPPGTGERW
jgi:hypothetical protein